MKQRAGLPLTAAAQQLRLGYRATLDRVLRGELLGWKDERGRWMVAVESVSESLQGQERARD